MASTEIIHVPEESRYRILVDGDATGLIDYTVSENTIRLTHTEIDTAKRTNGLGGELVKGALDQIRTETGYRVAPDCPFVADWIDGHPDYQDLLTR